MNSTKIFIFQKEKWTQVYDLFQKQKGEIAVTCLASIRKNEIILMNPLYYSSDDCIQAVKLKKEKQFQMIQECAKKEELYPCIIHSHKKYRKLGFSGSDMILEQKFNFVMKEMGLKNTLLMILVGNSLEEIIIHNEIWGDKSIKGILVI